MYFGNVFELVENNYYIFEKLRADSLVRTYLIYEGRVKTKGRGELKCS